MGNDTALDGASAPALRALLDEFYSPTWGHVRIENEAGLRRNELGYWLKGASAEEGEFPRVPPWNKLVRFAEHLRIPLDRISSAFISDAGLTPMAELTRPEHLLLAYFRGMPAANREAVLQLAGQLAGSTRRPRTTDAHS